MKFSTRQSYALRAMIHLAKIKSGSLSLGEIAKTEHISLKYLEAIFADLKKAGLVVSFKGNQGGYKLAKPAKNLTALAIISALETDKKNTSCAGAFGKQFCGVNCACGVQTVVNKLNEAIKQTLLKIKLVDLIKN